MSARAHGIYHYWRDAQRQDITEPWRWAPVANGTRLHGQRRIAGRRRLTITADYHGEQCEHLKLEWHDPQRPRRFAFRKHGNRLQWRADNQAPATLNLPKGTLLFPLLRAATGPLLRQLGPVEQNIVLPKLDVEPDAPDFLHPQLSPRRVIPDGTNWRFIGGAYGEDGALCQLNRDGLLAAYRWESPQGLWEVRLAAHQGHPL